MKTLQHFLFLVILFFLISVQSQAGVISFEDPTLPVGWSVSKGSLGISNEKVKLGNSALCWQWTAGDALSAINPDNLSQVSTNKGGGLTLWIYNQTASDATLEFAFYNISDEKKCSLRFKLNYRGWRCLWAEFKNDMGHDLSALSTLKIIAPSTTGNGTVFLDYLEFTDKVSWEKMSNFQYSVNEYAGIESYLEVRNIPATPPIIPSKAQQESFVEIGKRIDHWYVGSNKYDSDANYQLRAKNLNSYLSKGVANMPHVNANGTVNGSGLYPMDYHAKTVDGVKLKTFRNISEENLIQLAYDYKKNGNQASLNKALDLFEWFYDQGWADGSALGTLRFEMLRSAGFHHSVMMLRKELGSQFSQISNAERWFSLFGTAYADPTQPGELADFIRALAIPKLFYALTLNNEAERTAALIAYQKYMNNALAHAPGFLGSLKPDGSGYHHHGPYYNAYYPDVLYTGCLVYYLLHDTPFALSNETYNNLKQALLTFRFLCGEYNVPGATTGRFPKQTEVLQQLLPAFAYLALSTPQIDEELVATFKRLWKPDNDLVKEYIGRAKTDITFSTSFGEMELMLDAAKLNAVAESNPTGSLYLPYSGLLMVRQPNWTLSVKGFSSYIWDYESSGTENIYGRYQSYGQIEYADLNNNYRSYQPAASGWDWRMLPGTTTKNISLTNLDYNKVPGKHRNFSDKSFLGGVSMDATHAMFTNQLHDNAIDNSFYATKSVFVFDNAVYCMGSNINDKSTSVSFYTTLFQNVETSGNGVVTANGATVNGKLSSLDKATIADNFGNIYLVHDGKTDISKANGFYTAAINHGKIINKLSYAYTWLIQPTAEQTKLYQTASPIVELKKDTKAHAVYHKGEQLTAASIFEAGAVEGIGALSEVNKPILWMMKETGNACDIVFSDPDMNRTFNKFPINSDGIKESMAAIPGNETEISIRITGTYVKDTSLESNVEVSASKGITTLSYPKAKDGETYRVRLSVAGTGIQQNNLGEEEVEVITANGECSVRLSNPEKKMNISLLSINGTILNQLTTTGTAILPLRQLSSGVYLLKVVTDKGEKTMKITN